MGRRLFILTCIGALLCAATQARSIVIESFHADIRVDSDGTIDVTERIRPRFTGSWNGIYRTIPVEYRTREGLNYTLLLDLKDVTDESGSRLNYESSRERHYRKLKIWVPGAADATRTVVIQYSVRNALKFFEESDQNFSAAHDELYWNVTGDEWEVPIERASARILLPAAAAGLKAIAFTGGYGSGEQGASVLVSGTEITVATQRTLNFREGLTVVAGWNAGLISRPSTVEEVGFFFRSNVVLVVPVVAFAAMFWLWYTRGRDPRLRPISAQYSPPEGLTPAEVGALVDNTPDMRDITATLVDLAVRGYLLIEEKEKQQLLGLWSTQGYTFTLLKPRGEWKQLQSHEREMLAALFRRGDSVDLSELENKFYKDLPGIRDRIYELLVERRCYDRRPDRVKTVYIVVGIVLGFVTTWCGSLLSSWLGVSMASAFIAGILTGSIICIFGWFMPARTVQGSRVLEGVLGFEEFLERVESDRMERVVKTPEMFEKYLPYAMALGVDKTWAGAFEDICRQPPAWYRGGNLQSFGPRAFVSDLDRMSSRAAATMASAPRSSSGSSGFSGGSSGGGFGGGGGGGF